MSSSNAPIINTDKDYYAILNIPLGNSSATVVSKQQLRNAYHKALLKYHPDKAAAASRTAAGEKLNIPSVGSESYSRSTGGGGGDGIIYTVDDITNAYRVLSDPGLRAEYDREFVLRRRTTTNGSGGGNNANGELVSFHTGLEVVDLEDMIEEEEDGHEVGEEEGKTVEIEKGPSSYWYRGCRCGDEKGFIVTEDELEAEAQHGEILVGCRGCSLWIKVLFAVAGDEAEDEKAE